MARTFRALSALLDYPGEALQQAIGDIRACFASEALLPEAARRRLEPLLRGLEAGDLYDLQECYTGLFDRGRALSLHLFEHVHGESRDRGQAMADLQAHYAEHGFRIEAKELPDFLPLVLEFLSLLPEAEARRLLAEPLHVIAALAERLERRGSPYAAVFRALEALADAASEPAGAAELLDAPEDDPADLDSLDAEWAETEVRFGPGESDGCSRTRLAIRLRAHARSAETRMNQGSAP